MVANAFTGKDPLRGAYRFFPFIWLCHHASDGRKIHSADVKLQKKIDCHPDNQSSVNLKI